MNEYLLTVTISGYFVAAGIGLIAGIWHKDPTVEVIAFVIALSSVIATIVMLIALIGGFVEGVT